MNMDQAEITRYLLALFEATQGDTSSQASMHDVGAAIGMEKTRPAKQPKNSLPRGWLKSGPCPAASASPGTAWTRPGRPVPWAAAPRPTTPLGADPILTQKDRQTVETILAAVREETAALSPALRQAGSAGPGYQDRRCAPAVAAAQNSRCARTAARHAGSVGKRGPQ